MFFFAGLLLVGAETGGVGCMGAVGGWAFLHTWSVLEGPAPRSEGRSGLVWRGSLWRGCEAFPLPLTQIDNPFAVRHCPYYSPDLQPAGFGPPPHRSDACR